MLKHRLRALFPAAQMRPTFRSCEASTQPYHLQPFTVVRRPEDQTSWSVIESGPWYTVRFADGAEFDVPPMAVEMD